MKSFRRRQAYEGPQGRSPRVTVDGYGDFDLGPVKRWRRKLIAQKCATISFEAAPGHQLQVDFGDARGWIGCEWARVNLFVGTLD